MKYEIRKLCNNKVFLIGLLVVVAMAIYYGYDLTSNNMSNYMDDVDDIYKGEYTEDKYDLIEEKFGTLNQSDDDFFTYLSVYSQARIYKDNLDYRESVLRSAARLKNSSDEFTARANSRIEKIFSDMPKFQIRDTDDFNVAFNLIRCQNVGDILNIMVIIFVASYIFTVEHSADTYKLVFSSYSGRAKTYIRKIICIVGMAVGLAIISNVCRCLYVAIAGDGYIWSMPIQCNNEFINAPYVITLLEFVIITIILKAIGLIVIGVCSGIISLFFKKSIFPVIISSVVLVGLYMLCAYCSTYSQGGVYTIQSRYDGYMIFKQYTCFGLMDNTGFYVQQYLPMNALNYPVDMAFVNVFVNILFMFAMIFAGYQIYRKREA